MGKSLIFKRKKEIPTEPAPERTLSGNDEVTVQVMPVVLPIVNTAMATHIGTREYQQDAAYVCKPMFVDGLAYGILCDGMGGTAEGERASSETVAFMANRIATIFGDENIPAFLEKAAIDANELVLEQNAQLRQNSGTTLLTVLMHGGLLYWLSVGDSRVYIIRNGEIVQVTTDHNYALELQEMVESGQITQEQADADPGKEHLISYIGAPVLERIDVNYNPFEMHYGDVVMLCSDGLTKALYTDEIMGIVTRHGNDVAEAARVLPVTAFDQSHYGMDNTTVILMQYLGRPAEPMPP